MPVVNKGAADFAKRWKAKGDEKQDSQNFWRDLLSSVFGIANPERKVCFEKRVSLKNTSFIDVYIPETKVIIEQKSLGIDLEKAKKQSDGTELTPFGQAKRYNDELPYSEKARWIVTCNFERFLIYDLEKPKEDPTEILLKNFAKDYHLLEFLVKFKDEAIVREEELSVKAGEIVGTIYDALLKEYGENPTQQDYKSLNKLCVRLVFCLYAEDSGLFGDSGDAFCKYLQKFQASDLRREIIELFRVLDTPIERRNKFLQKDLAQFPYVNGSLFSVDEDLENIPNFSEELRDVLIKQAGEGFDWSGISPTIFGAVFESTLNPETRRSGGMHYTSIENIHKVIDPLFLDELRNEFHNIKSLKLSKSKRLKLEEFQRKLASLTFLDPACGSGNFLTETYLSLRKLENQILDELYHGSTFLGADFVVSSPIQVSIGQFYGIEINDFAVSVAKTALWIAESQTIIETEQILNTHIDFFPLKSYSNIVEENALRIDWNTVIPKEKLNYIMGNPPFLGYSNQNKNQKSDILSVYVDEKGKPYKTAGKIDYVAGWYMKAVQYMQNTSIHAAFVSTNSITQGEQVASVWQPLIERFGLSIIYAWRTFVWDSEASAKAHVHCVIVAFIVGEDNKDKFIFDAQKHSVKTNISPYLIEGDNIFLQNRTKPISCVNSMICGGKPVEGGFLIFTEEEKEDFVEKEPYSEKFFKRLLGGNDFINGKKRYCLWLYRVPPIEIKKHKLIMDRINKVKEYRLQSPKKSTRDSASTPYLFQEIKVSDGDYLVIPEVSSERRLYIPIGFFSKDVICTNAIRFIPHATMYDFGIVTSIVHMAWMRVVTGRLKSDYNYSINIVYNNFVWPDVAEFQKDKISKTAQAILDARALYPDSSLADLYDPLTMPPELLKAHKANDKAVLALYGFNADASEEEIVAKLMQMYSDKVKELQKSAK